MNQKEKLILKTLQSDFPLVDNPYCLLAERLGIKEDDLLRAAKKLKKKGFIRRIGAVVSSSRLGYKGVLIGAKVIPRQLKKAAAFVNGFDGVTHNYLRDNEYNLWFTYSAKTQRQISLFVSLLKKSGLFANILILPSLKTFKINAEFEF